MTSRPAVVTGATGYIGSRLTQALLSQGRQVHAIVRPSSDLRALHRVKGRLEVHRYDGSDKSLERVYRRLKKATTFHLASQSAPDDETASISSLIKANILFGAQILGAIRDPRKHIFINTGTFWQHRGTSAYEPMNLYAATKQAFFDILNYYRESTGMAAVSLELYDVYGPKDPRGKLFSQLGKQARSSGKLAMTPGHQKLDMVYVDDVVDAYRHAERLLIHDRVLPAACAVSSGRRLTLRKIVRLYEKQTGQALKIAWGAKPYRDGQVMTPWRGNALPGWRAKTSLEKGIQFLCDK